MIVMRSGLVGHWQSYTSAVPGKYVPLSAFFWYQATAMRVLASAASLWLTGRMGPVRVARACAVAS